jgi:hypothetical protein
MATDENHDAFPQTGIVVAHPGEKLDAMASLVLYFPIYFPARLFVGKVATANS